MADASRDHNRVTGLILNSNDGLRSPIDWWADPTTHRALVSASISNSGTTSTIQTGQAKIAVTGTAVQLTAKTLSNGIIITAKSTNLANIHIGDASVTNTEDGTGNGYILEPGSVSVAVSNANVIYINGTVGDLVSFVGS